MEGIILAGILLAGAAFLIIKTIWEYKAVSPRINDIGKGGDTYDRFFDNDNKEILQIDARKWPGENIYLDEPGMPLPERKVYEIDVKDASPKKAVKKVRKSIKKVKKKNV